MGSRTYSTAAARYCEIDYDKVFSPCKTALGSASEAIQKLTANIDAARAKRSPDRPTLQEVRGYYEELYGVSSRADKQEILQRAWRRMEPVEIKYFIRIMSQGSLRIGFETRSVIDAVAEAWDATRSRCATPT
ncbi:MAG: hypothetical protein U5K31_05410 [Balneolaceae bacterium]|nr:hypothetical protein [Balneolaceae bacterium]